MPHASPSALIMDQGQRVLLRIQGRFYAMSQEELRTLLGLPAVSAGLGISIDGDQLRCEFTADRRTVEMSAGQLHRRLVKPKTSGTSRQSKMG